MNNYHPNGSKQYLKRKFSLQEKEDHCKAFENSGLSQADFCQANGISKSALYAWLAHSHTKKPVDFVAVALDDLEHAMSEQSYQVQINLHLSDPIQLTFKLMTTQLASLIKELAYATSASR